MSITYEIIPLNALEHTFMHELVIRALIMYDKDWLRNATLLKSLISKVSIDTLHISVHSKHTIVYNPYEGFTYLICYPYWWLNLQGTWLFDCGRWFPGFITDPVILHYAPMRRVRLTVETKDGYEICSILFPFILAQKIAYSIMYADGNWAWNYPIFPYSTTYGQHVWGIMQYWNSKCSERWLIVEYCEDGVCTQKRIGTWDIVSYSKDIIYNVIELQIEVNKDVSDAINNIANYYFIYIPELVPDPDMWIKMHSLGGSLITWAQPVESCSETKSKSCICYDGTCYVPALLFERLSPDINPNVPNSLPSGRYKIRFTIRVRPKLVIVYGL